MRWHTVALIGILVLWPLLAVGQAETSSGEANKSWCELACSAAPLDPPPMCECAAIFGQSGSTGSAGSGERTASTLIDEMFDTHDAEMAAVDDYMIVESSNLTPMPDLRYFEKSGDGKYRWIPNAELGRREMVRNPPPDIPPELAQDPSLFLGGLEEALEILAEKLGDPGVVIAQAGKAAGEAEVGARGAYQEMREGIEGADDSAGLLGEEALRFFRQHGELRKDVYGIFQPDNPNLHFYEVSLEQPNDVPSFFNDQYQNIAENPFPTQEMLDEYSEMAEADPDDIEGGRRLVCDIIRLPANQPYDDEAGQGQFPAGTVLKSGEMWACYLGDGTLRPVRVRLEFQMPTDAKYEHQVVELIADEYRQVGPAVLAHRVKEKFILDGEPKGITELARDIWVNEGEPTQQEIIERISERMQNMDSSLGQ